MSSTSVVNQLEVGQIHDVINSEHLNSKLRYVIFSYSPPPSLKLSCNIMTAWRDVSEWSGVS